MVLRRKRVLHRGVEPVDLGLQARIHFRVREQAEDEHCERARGRVRTRDDREHAVIDELLHGRGGFVW